MEAIPGVIFSGQIALAVHQQVIKINKVEMPAPGQGKQRPGEIRTALNRHIILPGHAVTGHGRRRNDINLRIGQPLIIRNDIADGEIIRTIGARQHIVFFGAYSAAIS